uniref:Uncharacterized protein n=1 Tax=Trichogramma kaykai TaxID=54128 RepID=A0ABD2XHN8_9HYME
MACDLAQTFCHFSGSNDVGIQTFALSLEYSKKKKIKIKRRVTKNLSRARPPARVHERIQGYTDCTQKFPLSRLRTAAAAACIYLYTLYILHVLQRVRFCCTARSSSSSIAARLLAAPTLTFLLLFFGRFVLHLHLYSTLHVRDFVEPKRKKSNSQDGFISLWSREYEASTVLNFAYNKLINTTSAVCECNIEFRSLFHRARVVRIFHVRRTTHTRVVTLSASELLYELWRFLKSLHVCTYKPYVYSSRAAAGRGGREPLDFLYKARYASSRAPTHFVHIYNNNNT